MTKKWEFFLDPEYLFKTDLTNAKHNSQFFLKYLVHCFIEKYTHFESSFKCSPGNWFHKNISLFHVCCSIIMTSNRNLGQMRVHWNLFTDTQTTIFLGPVHMSIQITTICSILSTVHLLSSCFDILYHLYFFILLKIKDINQRKLFYRLLKVQLPFPHDACRKMALPIQFSQLNS